MSDSSAETSTPTTRTPSAAARLTAAARAVATGAVWAVVAPLVFLARNPLLLPIPVLAAAYFWQLVRENLTGAILAAVGLAAYGAAVFVLRGRAFMTLMAVRYLFKRRIAIVAVLSVMLCTAMVLIVGSIMQGFLTSAREAMHGARGDLTLKGDLTGVPFYDEFVKRVREGHPSLNDPDTGKPAVKRAVPIMGMLGLMQFGQGGSHPIAKVQIVGLKREDMAANTKWLLGLDRNRPGLTVTDKTAETLHADAGLPGDAVASVMLNLGGRTFDNEAELARRVGGLAAVRGLPEAERARFVEAVVRSAERRDLSESSDPAKFSVPDLSAREIRLPPKPSDLKPGEPRPPDRVFPGGGVIVGKDMVSRRNARGGLEPMLNTYEPVRLTVLPPDTFRRNEAEPPPSRLFVWEDYHRTGVYDADKETVYVDFDVLQDLLMMKAEPESGRPGRANLIQIDLAEGVGLEKGRAVVRRAWARMIDEITAEQAKLAADPKHKPTAGPNFAVADPVGGDAKAYIASANVRGGQVLLGADVPAGATRIPVQSVMDFGPGERVRILPDSFDRSRTEVRTIAAVETAGTAAGGGGVLVLDKPLDHAHPAGQFAGGGFTGTAVFSVDATGRDIVGNVYTQTWEEQMQTFLTAVQKEKVMMLTLFGIISMVAVLLVLSIFIQIVKEKTRDIGIIKSVGAGSGHVAGVFLLYALFIGVVGSGLGTALGYVVVWRINDVHDLIAYFSGVVIWDPTVYVLPRIPNIVDPLDAAWVAGIGVLASIVAAVVPAWLAARLPPVRALAYE
jgi:ABC-type lipoprotein release transport system permease subunit